LHARQPQARFPSRERGDDGGIAAQPGDIVEGLIDQLRYEGAVIAAHDARADRCGEDIGDRLAQMRYATQRATGSAVHSGVPVLLLPAWTPPCVCPVKLTPAATTSSLTVTEPVIS